jgi:hypothetical protein
LNAYQTLQYVIDEADRVSAELFEWLARFRESTIPG